MVASVNKYNAFEFFYPLWQSYPAIDNGFSSARTVVETLASQATILFFLLFWQDKFNQFYNTLK